jgi:ATP-dependent Clp protease ATP-binding subunit ClpA
VERFRRATGIFTAAARRIVAEDVLEVAARFGHRELGTGHLLLAILEHPDQSTAELIESLPDVRRLAAEVTDALPGDERA